MKVLDRESLQGKGSIDGKFSVGTLSQREAQEMSFSSDLALHYDVRRTLLALVEALVVRFS